MSDPLAGPDDARWELAHLAAGTVDDQNKIPSSRATLRRLCDEFHTWWVDKDNETTYDTMTAYLSKRLRIAAYEFNYDIFSAEMKDEEYKLGRLRLFQQEMKMEDDADISQKILDVACIFSAAHDYVRANGRLYVNSNARQGRRNVLPDDLQDSAKLKEEDESIYSVIREKNTNLQTAFLYLREILEGLQFRRAEGKYFSRVRLHGRVDAHAFAETMEVGDFVSMYTSHTANFKIWRVVTNPVSILDSLTRYLSDRSVPETPDLEENHHIRSYAGDALGRGAGVYCSRSDYFFEYWERDCWEAQAEWATAWRRLLTGDPAYVCSAPKALDVCIVHLDCRFPHDTQEELRVLIRRREAGKVAFREGFPWERRGPPLGDAGLAAQLAETLGELLLLTEPPAPRVGQRWRWVEAKHLPQEVLRCPAPLTREEAAELRSLAVAADGATVSLPRLPASPIPEDCVFCPLGERAETVLIPLIDSGLLPRHEVDATPERDAPHAHVEHEGRVFFRDDGPTWMDCDTREIDQIYRCQKFSHHDIFYLYALKGRLLFRVCEVDKHQFTLFFEGYGGCGKSTIMNAQMRFFPPHKRGILSSNVEPMFGMSQVMKEGRAEAIFCNEVASSLNLKQEEWQASTSGECGSFAVKNGKPLVMTCTAQHFWVGNSRPGFKNDMGQMSRRLAGVLMPFPVMPRDANIQRVIHAKLGHLQRREVLAYFAFVRLTGTIDPMSKPETLPPAFRDYFERCRRETDPIQDMIEQGVYVIVKPGGIMLMERFKQLFDRYRADMGISKPAKWSDALYRNAFNEKGVTILRMNRYDAGGETFFDVHVLNGLEEYVPRDQGGHDGV